MKKIVKTALSGALALTMAFSISISAFAEGHLNMYHNIQGGPTKSTDECWVYKNTGYSYYAECTSLLNSMVTVTGINNTPDKRLYFGSEKRIYFLSTTPDDRLYFEGNMDINDVTNYSRAYITIGAGLFLPALKGAGRFYISIHILAGGQHYA